MVKIHVLRKLVFLPILILISCSNEEHSIDDIILSVEEHFVPDSREGIFDVTLINEGDGFHLKGETDNPGALKALIDSLNELNIIYDIEVKILPQEQLGDRNLGMVNISVCNVRKEPRHSSELVTQGILGAPVKVLKKKGGWYLIQTPDKYLGWVDEGGIELFSPEDFESNLKRTKIIFTGIYGFSYRKPEEVSRTISDLTSGNVLFLEEILEFYYKISYPDGRIGFIKKTESEIFNDWLGNSDLDPEKLISVADNLLGIPYLWGGTSSKGMDCSGFTKTVYFMNGYILPRDASQQEHIGMLVDDKKDFHSIEEGDLLFFGRSATDSTQEKVIHVGIWIGDMKFIHASGDIHVSSMDPESEQFDEYNLNRYLRTKRLAGSEDQKKLAVGIRYFSLW